VEGKRKRKNFRVSLERTVDSVIVHDMKNLAFRLSALLQNMEDNYDNPLFKKSMTDILDDTIGKMNTIVKRFRDNQEQIVVKLRVDLNQILSDLISTLPARRIRNLRVDAQLTEVPLLWGDPFYLHNAFHTIIENAIEAMPEGGVLTVKSGLIKRRKKPKLCIEISDTGVGMDQTFLENRLFSPFTSTKQNGLGLGLFTCRQILAIHHGTIEVESAPGVGTTFLILLPAEENAK
jgi:hypothetical protein